MSKHVEMRNGNTTLNVAASKVDYWEALGFKKVEQARPAPKRRARKKQPGGDE